MSLLVEIPRRRRLARRLVKEAVISRESEQQIIDFYREPIDLSLLAGEPIAYPKDSRYEVTIATAEDIAVRRQEQVERIIVKLVTGDPLTMNERRYIAHAPLSSELANDLLHSRS